MKRFLLGKQKSESKSRGLLQGGGNPEIGSPLMSFEISLFWILSLPSAGWHGIYSHFNVPRLSSPSVHRTFWSLI